VKYIENKIRKNFQDGITLAVYQVCVVCVHAPCSSKLYPVVSSILFFAFPSLLLIQHTQHTETVAWNAAYSLENIIVTFAISGCQRRISRIIVVSVAFAAWEAKITSSIAMIVECALMSIYLMITIARPENMKPTVLSAKSFFSIAALHHTKCPAAMPFIGIVSVN
jgi:hypothetical protein